MPRNQELDPFTPGRACPRCQAEGAQPRYHAQPVLIVFGSGRQWPCSGMDGKVSAHMCTRCELCGFSWIESAPDGMDAAIP